jgi:hypothetical protein
VRAGYVTRGKVTFSNVNYNVHRQGLQPAEGLAVDMWALMLDVNHMADRDRPGLELSCGRSLHSQMPFGRRSH